MMRSSRIRIVFAACAVLASGAFAQTAVDGTCVPVATADSATQLAALATAYGVTVDELTSYADQGYAIGEIVPRPPLFPLSVSPIFHPSPPGLANYDSMTFRLPPS